MSVSSHSTDTDDDDDDASISSTFLEFCVKVREEQSFVYPGAAACPTQLTFVGLNRRGTRWSLENTNVTYLQLWTEGIRKLCRGNGQLVRNSKLPAGIHLVLRLIKWNSEGESILIFSACISSLRRLRNYIELPPGVYVQPGARNMLAHTQSLRSLTLDDQVLY
jgi:hypothetical protein